MNDKRIAELQASLSESKAREAELREELKLMTADRDSESRWASEYKQRAEAAEARIKASQEQTPEFVDFEVYGYASDNARAESWCKENNWSKSEFFSIIGIDWEQNDTIRNVVFHHYAEPIIPPELAELQRENAEQARWLRAKEAEIVALCKHAEEHAATIAELRKLLESKAPEGLQIVPKEPTDEMIEAAWPASNYASAHQRKECYKAMLNAAPQPKEAEVRVKLCTSCGFRPSCPTRNDEGGFCDDYVAQPKEPKQ